MLEKKLPSSIDSNGKIPLFAHPTISNYKNISSKKSTYFSLIFCVYGEINHHLSYYLLNREIALKEGFNTLLQHTFLDEGNEFYFHKINSKHNIIFNRHYERKIVLNLAKKFNSLVIFLSDTNNIFPSLSTDTATISYLKTAKTIHTALIYITDLFSLSKTNFAAYYSKEIKSPCMLLEFRHLDSTSLNLNSSILYIKVNKLYYPISFTLMSIYIALISALNLFHLLLVENHTNKMSNTSLIILVLKPNINNNLLFCFYFY